MRWLFLVALILIGGGKSDSDRAGERRLDKSGTFSYLLPDGWKATTPEKFKHDLIEGKPLKRTDETDAIFAHVKEVQKQVRNDPGPREISLDAKAKVALGDDVRGGRNQDERRR